MAKAKRVHSTPRRSASKSILKCKGDATTLRNALPFFRKRRGKIGQSWWNVTPSGNYVADLKTGEAYASAFLPLLQFNAAASDLAVIASDMAKAGRDLANNPKERHGIDDVAIGFMMEIGGMLQAAMASISIAATAIERNDSDLGKKFVELVKAGGAMRNMNRNTLFHDPNAHIFAKNQRAKK
jgi:hypothetical protein